jgi:hypothetical protein
LSAAVAHALTSGDAVLLRRALWPDGAAAPLGRHPGLPRSGDGVADRARDDAVDAPARPTWPGSTAPLAFTRVMEPANAFVLCRRMVASDDGSRTAVSAPSAPFSPGSVFSASARMRVARPWRLERSVGSSLGLVPPGAFVAASR